MNLLHPGPHLGVARPAEVFHQEVEQPGIAADDPADAQARQPVGLRDSVERDSPLVDVGDGRQAIGLVVLPFGVAGAARLAVLVDRSR